MRGLIIEGVAGTGKSTMLRRLRNLPKPGLTVLEEDVTLGELVAELADESRSNFERCQRLRELVPVVTAHLRDERFVLLERFHLSWFALMPDWNLVDSIDRTLAEHDVGLVLLDVSDSALAERSFHRPELASERWEQGLVEWYGSRERAIEAFRRSQQNRRDALAQTRLRTLHINTEARAWDRYLEQIESFVSPAAEPA